MKTALDIVAGSSSPVLMIGGLALPAHGVVRQTADVDFLVTDTNLGALDTALRAAGYMEGTRTDTFLRYRHSSPLLADIDLLLVDRATFDRLQSESQPYRVGDIEFRVPSLAHFVALKLHALRHAPHRELRDTSDIVDLLRHNPHALNPSDLESLCKQFGPPGIYQKLKPNL